ncbi:sirohydrochlorin cobaltochelatase [Labilibacter sediminis]|nr:sirohydrochlorin cobaltochelatase [Labilibacter sediminis]
MSRTSNHTSTTSISSLKKGILLVAFGSVEASANTALANIFEKVSAEFSGIDIRWAYTSSFIRKKLKAKGVEIDSPLTAISKMIDEGFTHITVQSMHTIPGVEYNYLVEVVELLKKMPKGAQSIEVGKPLLYSHQDIEKVVRVMDESYPAQEQEAVIWMGHGSPHFSNVFYSGLNQYLGHDCNHHFICTIEGYPTLDDAIKWLRLKGVTKVTLVPFVSVVGMHVKKDMCGDNEKSWLKMLKEEGFSVECVLKGTGEMDRFVSLWITHLKDAWNKHLV